MSEMRKGRHAVFLLRYHVVFVVKYRNRVITDEIGRFILDTAKRILEGWEGGLVEGNFEADHVHLLIDMSPKYELATYMGVLKQSLARAVKKAYPDHVKRFLWKSAFWTESYYIATVGDTNLGTVVRYIENQGKAKRPYRKTSVRWNSKGKNDLSSPP